MSGLLRRRWPVTLGTLAVISGLVLGGVAWLRHAPRAQLVLLGTVSEHGSARVTAIQLSGPGGSVSLSPPDTPLARAPAPTDLGVYQVPAARYRTVTVWTDGRSLTTPITLDMAANSLTPLLIALSGTSLTAYAGNEPVNEGLLTAGGRFTAVPDVAFTDQSGRPVPFSSLRGRVTVIAALDSHCHETCPLYTAILGDLERTLHARGWGNRVNVAEVTMDPERDTPPELAADARMTGASWELLTADPRSTLQFWTALHATYYKHPNVGPAPIDWYTGRPEAYHLHHDSVAVVLDEAGIPRYFLQGNPRLGHSLSGPLAHLLGPGVTQSGLEADSSWSLAELLDRIDVLLHLPGETSRAPETALRRGALAPDFSLPSLDHGRVSLSGVIGHPVVVNFWATWCGPCRQELPLFAAAASSHPQLRILAVDEGEDPGDIAPFLREVLGDRQPLTVLLDSDRTVGRQYAVAGLPVSVFVDSTGMVRDIHVGQLSDLLLAKGLRSAGS